MRAARKPNKAVTRLASFLSPTGEEDQDEGALLMEGRDKPNLINSEVCVFEFLSFGFAWRFMVRREFDARYTNNQQTYL